MSNNGAAVIPAHRGASGPPLRKALAQNALVHGPILRTLLRLAWPNVLALSAGTCVVIAETSYQSCRRWRRWMLPPPKLAIFIIGPIMLMIWPMLAPPVMPETSPPPYPPGMPPP